VKESPGRPTYRWEGNIEMDLQEVRWGEMDWIVKDHDSDRSGVRLNAAMKLWLPCNAGNFLSRREPVSFSRTTLILGDS